MVIGAEEDGEELGELAGLVVPPVVLLLLLLPPLLHAARTPTQSATAPSAATFLENQGRCALTPGSSFLIGHESSVRIPGLREPALGGYAGKFGCRAVNAAKQTLRVTRTAPYEGLLTIVCKRDWTGAGYF